MTTIQTNQIRVHKSKHVSLAKKELLEADKIRFQAIDDVITNGFRKAIQIPQLQILRNEQQLTYSDELNISSILTPKQSKEFNEEEKPQQKNVVTLDTEQTITARKTFLQSIYANKVIKTGGTNDQILLTNGDTANTGDFLPVQYPHAKGSLTLEPNTNLREGVRIMKSKSNWNSFVFTRCNEDIENDDGVWTGGNTLLWLEVNDDPPFRAMISSVGALLTDWSLHDSGNFRAYVSYFIENANDNYHDP
ncbi:MAG: hypothetical protein EZS28_030194 [Streblomastix strix]|uniref:Uncharacterized protein n=1 Tax=Streblomastix strix TaxID=222440 RepID=A0A5J4UVU9_9EUKA|nr:MAG: hypothetical protein EZS28_030194 [Streblomastix strix]